MRVLMLLMAVTAVGCASQPSEPPTRLSTTPVSSVASSGAKNPPDSVEAQRLAAAKNLNLKVIDKDGKQLFCRSNMVTGSHIQRDVTCYTGDQLDTMQAQMERDLDRLNLRPSQSPGLPSK
jgi:hypothetical protein